MHEPRKSRKIRNRSDENLGTPRKTRNSSEESMETQRKTSTDSKLTVKLPNALIKEIKVLSIGKNYTIKETCEEALRDYIVKHPNKEP